MTSKLAEIPVAKIPIELADVGVGYEGVQHDIGP
jgi:hypothetical protein